MNIIEYAANSARYTLELTRPIKVGVDNASASTPAFGANSPIDLKPTGEKWLQESGLKEYIDANKESLLAACREKQNTNPYEVQKHIFGMFDTYVFPPDVDDKLKKFAFQQGTTMGIVRRVGAIYLRNLCIDNFGMKRADIDAHDPDAKPSTAS